jgi:hypothetical protein
MITFDISGVLGYDHDEDDSILGYCTMSSLGTSVF